MLERRTIAIAALGSALVLLAGLLLPERLVIPVAGASPADWHHETFWFEPWGASGVHKGIDIFAAAGTSVVAASRGLVVFDGDFGRGGRAVIVLGPKWRLHYYAHLSRSDVAVGAWLSRGEPLGAVGTSGNAAGKPAHLHYSIVTLLPYPWRLRPVTQGWLLPFFLDPHEQLTTRRDSPA